MGLLAYCTQSGMVTGARIISPYYPLLLPVLLLGGCQSELVRRQWWRALTLAVVLLAFPVVVLTPGRPLWPALTILSKLQSVKPNHPLIVRALKVYTVYGDRSDSLADVRAALPPGLRIVGFLADGDDMDISFWRPLGERRVDHILLSDNGQQIRERGITYAVVGGAYLVGQHVSLDDWLRRTNAELITEMTVALKVIEGPQPWYIVRFKPD